MSDHPQNQWMQPPRAAHLEGSPRTPQTGDRYGMQYTPNEPDAREPAYAAQAAAARRRAGRQQAAPQPAVKPDAVLYRQSTGVVELPPIPAAPMMAAVPVAASRKPDAPAPLPFREMEPGASTRRRRRVMPQDSVAYEEPAPESSLAQKAEEAKQAAREHASLPQQTGSLAQKAEAAKQAAREKSVYSRTEALMEAEDRYASQSPLDEPEETRPVLPPAGAEASRKKNDSVRERLNIFARRPAKNEEPEQEPQLLVNTSHTAFGLHNGLSLELTNTFASDEEDEEEEENGRYVEDHMETGRMPAPAPVSTLEPPRRSGGALPVKLLKAVVVLMLLAAIVSFLWLSGIGEYVSTGVQRIYADLTDNTVATGAMSVVPEAAAVPTTLLVTLTTDHTIADLRLLRDDGQVLEADISCNADGGETLWTCRVPMEEAYEGFIRAQLLNAKGEWRIGSSSRYVNIQ